MNIQSTPEHDWRTQFKNSIKTFEQLDQMLPKNPRREQFFRENQQRVSLPFSVTPHFVSLMSGEPDCPIFLQVISSAQELVHDVDAMRDPLGEESRQQVPHLVHRYPDRVLFLATDRCAAYCRFCHRKRWVGQGPSPTRDEQEEAFLYIEQHKEIHEIVFSGGDPLVLSTPRIKQLIERSLRIPHIQLLRFHTRMLSFAPMRIDEELLAVFNSETPIFIVTHFNHPQEINEHTIHAIKRLQQSGVVLLNQAVLLKGINDHEATLKELFMLMARLKIRPYYLHQCDMVVGSSHFRVPLGRSLELMAGLRGHVPGHCLPTLVVDIPGGHGKVPLIKSPIIREDDTHLYLRGFLGGVGAYPKDE